MITIIKYRIHTRLRIKTSIVTDLWFHCSRRGLELKRHPRRSLLYRQKRIRSKRLGTRQVWSLNHLYFLSNSQLLEATPNGVMLWNREERRGKICFHGLTWGREVSEGRESPGARHMVSCHCEGERVPRQLSPQLLSTSDGGRASTSWPRLFQHLAFAAGSCHLKPRRCCFRPPLV